MPSGPFLVFICEQLMANKFSRVLAASVLATAFAAGVAADPPLVKTDSRLTTRPAVVLSTDELLDELPAALRVNLGRADEYDKLIAELKAGGVVTDADVAGILERLGERNRLLRAWADDPEKGRALLIKRLAIADAARKKDDAEYERLRLDAKPLSDDYMAVRSAGRVMILSGLTDEQLNFVAARSLRAKVTQELPLRLTAEQAAALDGICLREVQKGWTREMLAADPFFRDMGELVPTTVNAVRSELVTAEQNAALDKRAARLAATQASTTRPSAAADEPAVPAVREPAP